jgi:hypothetical protein
MKKDDTLMPELTYPLPLTKKKKKKNRKEKTMNGF